MTKAELLTYLESRAKAYLPDSQASIERNGHMFVGLDAPAPSLAQIAVVLTDFINTIGMHQCVDLALCASDLIDHNKQGGAK